MRKTVASLNICSSFLLQVIFRFLFFKKLVLHFVLCVCVCYTFKIIFPSLVAFTCLGRYFEIWQPVKVAFTGITYISHNMPSKSAHGS